MGEILGIGITHYPPLLGQPEGYANVLRRVLASPLVPPHLKDPQSWPPLMQEEYANERALARDHQARLVAAFRRVRRTIDDFGPDAVVIFGDDQYENFREDCIPPFCIYLHESMESRPYLGGRYGVHDNPWQEPVEKVFVHRGHKPLAKQIATELIERGFPVSYAFTNSHYAEKHGPTMLTHAFLNGLLYLDWDRQGFDYPVIPIQVNCYGKDVVPSRGGTGHLDPAVKDVPYGGEFGPPGPTPASCYRLGGLVREILDESPGKYVVMASSGWSHAFLVAKHYWLYPDIETDRTYLHDLRTGQHHRWAQLTNDQIDEAGDQEFKNWICLAGAMPDRTAEVVEYLENYIFNSNTCFAIFRPEGS